LFSVDLVDRPAANPSGLFQDVDSSANGMAEITAQEKTFLQKLHAFFSTPAEPVNFEVRSRELEAQLTAANTKLTEFAALQAKVSELEAAKAKMETEFAAKVADFDAKVEKAAGEKSTAIMASLGVPAVSTGNSGGAKQDFSALVQAQIAKGMTKGKAIELCVKDHPTEYAEWRASGKTQTL
jgi:Skp family chaperone for outer membrane proteins